MISGEVNNLTQKKTILPNSVVNRIAPSVIHSKTKGQLSSELIYEVIVSPKMPTKNSALEVYQRVGQRTFGWDFGRNDDLIN